MTMEKRNHRVRHTIFSVLTALITVIIMIPFIWLVILSFKSNTQIMNEPFSLPESFGLENYYIAFRVLPLVNMYKNTMIIAAFTEILCLAVTFTGAFALTRLTYKNRKLQNGLYLFLISGLMIPIYILLFPIYRINIQLKFCGKNQVPGIKSL